MTKDAAWSCKVAGVLCALLAELRGKVFTGGNISNEMGGGGVIASSHNQPIVVFLIVCFQWTFIHRITGFIWRQRLW